MMEGCNMDCAGCQTLAVDLEGRPIGQDLSCDCLGPRCVKCLCCTKHCLCRLGSEGEDVAAERPEEPVEE